MRNALRRYSYSKLLRSFPWLVSAGVLTVGISTASYGAASNSDTSDNSFSPSLRVKKPTSYTDKPAFANAPDQQPDLDSSSQSTSTADVNVQTKSTGSSSRTEMEVNGKSIPLTGNSSIRETIRTESGHANVHVSQRSDSSGSSHSSSSVRINITQEGGR